MNKLIGYIAIDSGAMKIADYGDDGSRPPQLAFRTDVGDGIYFVYVDRSGKHPKVVIDLDPAAHRGEFDEHLDDLSIDLSDDEEA